MFLMIMISARCLFPAALSALLLLTTACASVRNPRPQVDRLEILLTEQPPPAGRTCHILDLSEPLPDVTDLVDADVFIDRLEELRTENRDVNGHALLSLSYDENGWSSHRDLIEHTLPHNVASSVERLVFENLKDVPAGEERGYRLRVDLGDTIGLRIGRQELCPASLRIVSTPADREGFIVVPGRGRYQRATVEVLVDQIGSVADVRLVRTALPLSYEQRALDTVRSRAFDPALLDGVPTVRWEVFQVLVPVAY